MRAPIWVAGRTDDGSPLVLSVHETQETAIEACQEDNDEVMGDDKFELTWVWVTDEYALSDPIEPDDPNDYWVQVADWE